MQALIDGTEVTSRSFYFLLDWNERDDWRYIAEEFKQDKINKLSLSQYIQLFEHAAKEEAKFMKTSIDNTNNG